MPYSVKAEITDNARRVLEARYLCRDKQGQIVETPEDMFRRVAAPMIVFVNPEAFSNNRCIMADL